MPDQNRFDGMEQTDSGTGNPTANQETAAREALMEEIAGRAEDSQGYTELQFKTVNDMIKETHDELDKLQGQLNEAKENLMNFHIEVEEAIAKGEPIPGNYMGTEKQLLGNIQTNREQIEALQPRLNTLYDTQVDLAKKLEEQAKAQPGFADKLREMATKVLDTLRNGFQNMSKSVAQANLEFANGVKSAYKNIGDNLTQQYTKVVTQSQTLAERAMNAVKEAGQWVVDKAGAVKDSVQKGWENLVHNAAQKQLDHIENKQSFKAGELGYKLEQATGKVAEMNGKVDQSKILQNAVYNVHLDNAKKLGAETIDFVKSELERRQQAQEKGFSVDPKVTKQLEAVLAKAEKNMERLNELGPKTYEPKQMDMNR